MRIFSFDGGRDLTHWVNDDGEQVPLDPNPSGARITPFGRLEGVASIVCMHVDPGGVIGRHPAGADQLFCVVAGEGWVAGADDERVPIGAGRAVYFERGEEHSSGSEVGMTAIVIESSALDPAVYLKEVGG